MFPELEANSRPAPALTALWRGFSLGRAPFRTVEGCLGSLGTLSVWAFVEGELRNQIGVVDQTEAALVGFL